MTTRALLFVGFTLSLLFLPATGYASEPGEETDVTLYEISERVTFYPDTAPDNPGVLLRDATAPLLGLAKLGTPLCPSQLLVSIQKTGSCTVSAVGGDRVSTVTGQGPVWGMFDVVVKAPGSSSVHVPNLPVMSGTFEGNVDLSNAMLLHLPLGSITGVFTVTHVADPSGQLVSVPTAVTLPFRGTFRMPFEIDEGRKPAPPAIAGQAYYLADDLVTLIPIRPEERSIGFATVRLELKFGE
jgi:hypothetical protein